MCRTCFSSLIRGNNNSTCSTGLSHKSKCHSRLGKYKKGSYNVKTYDISSTFNNLKLRQLLSRTLTFGISFSKTLKILLKPLSLNLSETKIDIKSLYHILKNLNHKIFKKILLLRRDDILYRHLVLNWSRRYHFDYLALLLSIYFLSLFRNVTSQNFLFYWYFIREKKSCTTIYNVLRNTYFSHKMLCELF